MKSINKYAALLMAITPYTYAYSQEQPVALVQVVHNITERPIQTNLSDPSTSSVSEENKSEEETKPEFELSGSIDTYFRSAFGYQSYAPATSFANRTGFGLGMANLVAYYAGDKMGFTADLVFGPRGQDAVFNSSQGIINQLFAYYQVSERIKLNMGQFNTFVGYEVISPTVNFHYSTSYLFSYGPFNHTGLRADIDLGGGFVGKLAVLNPTDIVEFNPVNTYTIGAQLGHTSESGGIWLNALIGDQDGKLNKSDYPYTVDEDGNITGFLSSAGTLFQIDLTAGFNLTDKFYIGLNTSYQSLSPGEEFISEGVINSSDGPTSYFVGVALYPNIKISEALAVGARIEYFNIQKNHLQEVIGLDDDGNGNVTALTVSANYKVGALTLIPEFRIDKTSNDSFLNKNYTSVDSMSSVAIAAVYKF